MPTAPHAHPQNTDELYQALRENDRRPYGRTRTVTAEELVDAAERFEEPLPLVHALLELQEAYTYGAEPRKSPVVFARLLTLFDEQPDVFDERLRHTLFWRFKWVAGALCALPEIPLTALRQWLTEMRDRLAGPDVAGELDDRLVAQLRLTRARALHAGEDLKAATAEFVALAAESADWDDDPGSHAMIAAETAVLLGESGAFGRAREAADQALAAHARTPRHEQLSNCLRELARLQAQQQGADGLPGARAFLADAGRIADEARAAGYEARGRSMDSALAYEHGRVDAYAGAYEDALAALEKALALLGEPGPEQGGVGERAECVRLAGVVEGVYLERPAPALTRLDAAVSRLTALGHTEEAEALTSLAARLRDEE